MAPPRSFKKDSLLFFEELISEIIQPTHETRYNLSSVELVINDKKLYFIVVTDMNLKQRGEVDPIIHEGWRTYCFPKKRKVRKKVCSSLNLNLIIN